MAVAAAQHRRAVAGGAIELGRGRPATPEVLVEPSSGEPPPRLQRRGARGDDGERLVDGLRAPQVHLAHLEAPPHEVDVRVEPARDHESAAEIHALRTARLTSELGGPADRRDAAVPRQERLGRLPAADVDASAVEQDRAH
ncbi:MAG: hypothetical protein AUG02_02650 [Chloroflexi bacterium 13_1_20CM_2_70_9]|nr:MAG: hypothetical protein AUG02_02650 [Chloroflexi bacterium 13_1_20CM_2_70_9]